MKDEGFPPALRIRRRRDYLGIQRDGEKRHTQHFLVFSRPGPMGEHVSPARLGITVTRKVGNAVTRNRIKRLVREAFRRQAPSGVDMVWVAKRNAATVTFGEVSWEMECWRRHWSRQQESA